jgi:uncharacterized protein (TIGR02466 family)
MPVQLATPFAIPFGLANWAESQLINQELRRLFLEREAQGATYSNQNATMSIRPGLFESRFDLFRWQDSCVRHLREFCWKSVFEFMGMVGAHTPEQLSQLVGHADAWFHISRSGGHFGLHNHPMASWSGVYCVDPGDTSEAAGGLLSFPHPLGAAGMYVDASTRKLDLPYNFSTREYRLAAGQLVLFPSWLPHQVTPYYGRNERITVAFNAWFTPSTGKLA